MPKEQYMCQLCANHGTFNQPKKGHKQKCPHRYCPCPLCALNTKRRRLDQMERQLRTGPEGVPSPPAQQQQQQQQPTGSSNSPLQLPDGATGMLDYGSQKLLFPQTFDVTSLMGPEAFSLSNSLAKSLSSPPPVLPAMPVKQENFLVALPATMKPEALKALRKPQRSPSAEAERKRRTLLFEQTLAEFTACLEKRSKPGSIFHSVSMLAEPAAVPSSSSQNDDN